MDEYIKGYIVRLYPDAGDVVPAEKRVLIKLDSGPGQLNIKLLAYLKSSVFHSFLYSYVPNTTAHVTCQEEETDMISYYNNIVKSKLRSNTDLQRIIYHLCPAHLLLYEWKRTRRSGNFLKELKSKLYY